MQKRLKNIADKNFLFLFVPQSQHLKQRFAGTFPWICEHFLIKGKTTLLVTREDADFKILMRQKNKLTSQPMDALVGLIVVLGAGVGLEVTSSSSTSPSPPSAFAILERSRSRGQMEDHRHLIFELYATLHYSENWVHRHNLRIPQFSVDGAAPFELSQFHNQLLITAQPQLLIGTTDV